MKRRKSGRKPGLFRLTKPTTSCRIISVEKEDVVILGEFASIEEAKTYLIDLKGIVGRTLHIITTIDNRAVHTESM